MNTSRSSRLTVVLALSAIGAVWSAMAWFSRLEAPWAIRQTSPAFALALAATYVAAWAIVVARSQTPRLALFRALAATVSGMLGLVVLEMPAAAGIIDYSHVRGALTGGWQGPTDDFVTDHELSFKRPPHARWAGRPRSNMAQAFNLPLRSAHRQTFTTDSNGFRNATDMDSTDIVLVGDSYVEGAYVSDEETAAERLHELTGERVANLGLSGYGPLQELQVLEKFGLPLKPHLAAWFFFEGNDLDDDQAYENAMAFEHGVRPPAVPEDPGLRWRALLNRSFTMNAFMQLRQTFDPVVPNAVDSFGWFRDRGGESHRFYFYDFYATRQLGDYERSRFESAKATFRQANEICRARGVKLIVFYVPIKFRVYGDLCTFPAGSPCTRWHPWDLESQFAAFCREAGIPYVSITPAMRQAARAGDVVYTPEDSHWSPDGHRLVAGLIRDAEREER